MTATTLQSFSHLMVVLAALGGGVAAVAGLLGTLSANKASKLEQQAANVRISTANSIAEVAKAEAAKANAEAASAGAEAAKAIEAAAQADLKTAELREENTRLQLQLAQERSARQAMLDQLKPRSVTKQSLAKLKARLSGKVRRVAVYTLVDAEASTFAHQLMDALQKADVEVAWYRVSETYFNVPGVSLTGLTIVEAPPHGDKTEGYALFTGMIEAGYYPSLMTPPEPAPGIEPLSLFISKRETPFVDFPAYLKPPELERRRPAWDPAPVPRRRKSRSRG